MPTNNSRARRNQRRIAALARWQDALDNPKPPEGMLQKPGLSKPEIEKQIAAIRAKITT